MPLLRSSNVRNSTLREYERTNAAVLDYIEQHYKIDITIDDFCKEMGYSRRSTQRSLLHYGTTWSDLLRRRRLNEAARRLSNTNLSVARIAGIVGYRQPAHFARVFRVQFGLSPREYRQNFNGRKSNGTG